MQISRWCLHQEKVIMCKHLAWNCSHVNDHNYSAFQITLYMTFQSLLDLTLHPKISTRYCLTNKRSLTKLSKLGLLRITDGSWPVPKQKYTLYNNIHNSKNQMIVVSWGSYISSYISSHNWPLNVFVIIWCHHKHDMFPWPKEFQLCLLILETGIPKCNISST